MADYDYGDVVFDVWMRGGNADLVDRDRVAERQADGYDRDEAVAAELRGQRQRRKPEPDDDTTW